MRGKSAAYENEDYIETVENDQVPVDEESRVSGKPKTGRVCNSKFVRVRRGPSGSSNVVTVLDNGDHATILDRVSGFYKILTHSGHIGYIPSTYFQED